MTKISLDKVISNIIKNLERITDPTKQISIESSETAATNSLVDSLSHLIDINRNLKSE